MKHSFSAHAGFLPFWPPMHFDKLLALKNIFLVKFLLAGQLCNNKTVQRNVLGANNWDGVKMPIPNPNA